MKRIMKVAALTACVGAMLCFAGCGKGDSDKGAVADAKVAPQGKSVKDVATTKIKQVRSDDDPAVAVLTLLTTMAKGNADDVFLKRHCTERSAESMMMMRNELKEEFKGATFEIVSVKVTGDDAVVMIKQNGGKEDSGKTYEMPVKKVGGQWKCDNY